MNRILLYHTFSGYGGIENQIVNVVDALEENYHFFFAKTPNERLIDELCSHNVSIIPSWPHSLLSETYHIASYVRKNKIEIIQVHTFSDAIKIRLVKIFCPKVKIVYRVHTYIACSWISGFKKKIYYLLDSLTSFAVKFYIVNGEYMMNEFKKNTFIRRSKLKYMLDGIKEVGEYSKVNSFHSPIRILMIANVIPHKGHDIMIKSSSILKRKGYSFKVTVLGDYMRDSQYYESIRNMIVDLGVEELFDFVGFDKDISKYLTNSDLVVLPSDSEGTPNCIMEGMSMGRIVICSDTGALREMIDDGISGYLCKPQDPESFAYVLEKALVMSEDKIADMSENGYKKWLSAMSIDAMKSNLLHIYKEIR